MDTYIAQLHISTVLLCRQFTMLMCCAYIFFLSEKMFQTSVSLVQAWTNQSFSRDPPATVSVIERDNQMRWRLKLIVTYLMSVDLLDQVGRCDASSSQCQTERARLKHVYMMQTHRWVKLFTSQEIIGQKIQIALTKLTLMIRTTAA